MRDFSRLEAFTSTFMDDGAPSNSMTTACACSALRRAARATSQFYDLVLQPSGLKCTQFFALKNIYEAGEIAQWKFSRENTIAVETLSRRFAALRRRGLITSRIGGNHGERIYTLTDEGKQAFQRALPYWERAQRRLCQTIGTSEWNLLLRLCEAAVQAAHKAETLRDINSPAARQDQGCESHPEESGAIAS